MLFLNVLILDDFWYNHIDMFCLILREQGRIFLTNEVWSFQIGPGELFSMVMERVDLKYGNGQRTHHERLRILVKRSLQIEMLLWLPIHVVVRRMHIVSKNILYCCFPSGKGVPLGASKEPGVVT